ncbi:MAG: transporter ATP-binding protein [Herminiimonas sp.]|nr:transporter ATP-binding protein [Herminiimonas sp.]
MNLSGTVFTDLRVLFTSLPAERHIQLCYLVTLMLIAGLMEMFVLGAIVPFLAVLADPKKALEMAVVTGITGALGWTEPEEVRTKLAMLFACTAAVAGIIRFSMVFLTSKFNFRIGHEIGAEVYRRSLCQPYEVHLARSSSEIVGAIGKVDTVVFVVFSFLNSCSSALTALFIGAALLLIDPVIASFTLLGFATIYAAVSIMTRQCMNRSAKAMNDAYGKRVQSMQEGLGGIRDLLLDKTQPLFLGRFNEADRAMREAQASIQIIAPSPRIIIETLGIVLIASLGYYRVSASGLSIALPTLGALALGAQRLMPMLQQSYQGWVYIYGCREVLSEVVKLLQQPVPAAKPEDADRMPFEHAIRMENVSFQYGQAGQPVVRQLDMTITKGARVGIVGLTGSGKSTAMDLLLGLLHPVSGRIIVDATQLGLDNKASWQKNIAHVPQSIFLTESSFCENIAFGVPLEDIDMERVRDAARKAQIADFIQSAPEGYWARVGERGVNLSGGQRQRVGIARALYKRATVLIFDEATSALDNETESAVMEAIDHLGRDITIIMIAHRTSTLQDCDLIYRLGNGRAELCGGYQDYVQYIKTA